MERPHWQQRVLLALIFCFSTADFLQSGVVVFNAAPIMGDISASPEEYSSVATVYAIFGILAIYKHRWMVERLGWRTFSQLSMALFALGCLICARSHELDTFGLGRMLMALGGATAFTMGRVIVSHLPGPQRFNGIRFFASGLATGSIAGPLLASLAFSHGSWRDAFLMMMAPALLIAMLSEAVLPVAAAAHDLRSQPHPRGMVLLMLGSFLLLHALQRSAFDWYIAPPWVSAGGVAALLMLVAFIALEHRHAHPPLRLTSLLQRRYLLGLTAFTLAYALIGANNYVLPVMIRQGLGLPLEAQGRLLATGAIGSLLTWLIMAKVLTRVRQPLPYYGAGFLALTLSGFTLSRVSETADAWQSIAPALMLNGAFVMLVLATTAIQTFMTLQHDETVFSHANQLKNMLAQYGSAAGVAVATLLMQWRSTAHYAELVESVTLSRVGTQDMMDRLSTLVAGADPNVTHAKVMALLSQMVSTQATFSAASDYFLGLAALAAALLSGLLAVSLIRRMSTGKAEQPRP